MKDKTTLSYEVDFYAWLMYTAQLLRQGRFSKVDTDYAVQESKSIGRCEKCQLVGRLSVLIAQLLK